MTKYLVDTNVVSQLVKPRPSASVLSWLSSTPDEDIALSVITVRELWYGVQKARRERAASAETAAERIGDLIEAYADRTIDIDRDVAIAWAAMLARSNKHVDDTGLAATAAVHGLVLVTRNVAHLRGRGVPLLDPFKSPAERIAPAT